MKIWRESKLKHCNQNRAIEALPQEEYNRFTAFGIVTKDGNRFDGKLVSPPFWLDIGIKEVTTRAINARRK